MFDRRHTKILRDLWLHRARTLLVVLAITVGIVGAGTVLNTWALLRRVTRDGYLATNPPAATLRFDRVDSLLLSKVAALPEVSAVQGRRSVVAAIRTADGPFTAQLVAATDLATSEVGKLVRVSGDWPPPDSAITVEQSSVEFSGVRLGDDVTLQIGDGTPVSVRIRGVARDQGLAPGWMEHVVYAFVTPATLERLGAPAGMDELRFTVRTAAMDAEAIRRTVVRIRTIAESMGRRMRSADIPEPGEHVHAAQMNSLLFIQLAFGILALFLSALLVVNLVSAMLTGQVREIGVMKAIGASPEQLARMYLWLALLLGALACVVALPLAAYLGRRYAEFSASLLNFDVTGYAIPSTAYAVQLLTGLLLPVVAAAIPVWRGCRVSVAEALRDLGIGRAEVGSGGALFGQRTGLGRPLLLSLRNAFRRRQRMVLTLSSLSLGGAVFLGALNLRTSIRGTVGMLYGEQMKFDMLLRFDRAVPVDSLESLVRREPGVRSAEAWGGVRALVMRPDSLVAASFPLVALPATTEQLALPVVSGRWLLDSVGGELVINTRVAHLLPAAAVGERLTLTIEGRQVTLRVVGIVESGPAPVAYLSRHSFTAMGGESGARTVVIRATSRDVAAQSELIDRVRERFTSVGIAVANGQLIEANRVVIEDHLLMVAGFLLAMSGLAIVVGGLGLASTMSLAVLERTREIGVMRAIGATHRAILSIILVEGVVVGVLSWLLAIPLSVPISRWLGDSFGRIMLPVAPRVLPEGEAVLVWLAVVMLVSVAASAWPARRALAVTTAAALAYE
jgi:putative ABC transport system permease protein